MKIVHINTFPYKATGSIMLSIHRRLLQDGHESIAIWGRGREAKNEHEFSISDPMGVMVHGLMTRLLDRTGDYSIRATKRLIIKLDEIKPEIIHIHNLHGYYLNIPMLFDYIKKKSINVVWTLHDCWSFTGHCAYFDMVECDKWKTGCHHCQQKKTYPASILIDRSKKNWRQKKEMFSGVKLNIVTPCKWLENLVKQSFLQDSTLCTIYNGIDRNVYHPIEMTDIEAERFLGKKVILGVASEWTERKGLADFVKLAEKLDSEKYAVITVGLTKKQCSEMPKQMIALERTSNLTELLKLYTRADVFFNPTYEDNFPTTNLEAMACGTPVITYKTGGSPESITQGNGWVVPQGDLDKSIDIIDNIDPKQYVELSNRFDLSCMVEQYISLYNEIKK